MTTEEPRQVSRRDIKLAWQSWSWSNASSPPLLRWRVNESCQSSISSYVCCDERNSKNNRNNKCTKEKERRERERERERERDGLVKTKERSEIKIFCKRKKVTTFPFREEEFTSVFAGEDKFQRDAKLARWTVESNSGTVKNGLMEVEWKW